MSERGQDEHASPPPPLPLPEPRRASGKRIKLIIGLAVGSLFICSILATVAAPMFDAIGTGTQAAIEVNRRWRSDYPGWTLRAFREELPSGELGGGVRFHYTLESPVSADFFYEARYEFESYDSAPSNPDYVFIKGSERLPEQFILSFLAEHPGRVQKVTSVAYAGDADYGGIYEVHYRTRESSGDWAEERAEYWELLFEPRAEWRYRGAEIPRDLWDDMEQE